MKTKNIILSALALCCSMSAFAVKGVEDGSKYGTGEDSIRCLENLSIYTQYYKIKDYKTSFDAWKVVYEESPLANGRNLYSQGAFLIAYKIGSTQDAAEKKAYFDLLMDCYERRVKYFGQDAKYPETYIRGRQAMDYLSYSNDAKPLDKVLPWLQMSVEGLGQKADADVINAYFIQLEQQYQSDKAKYQESFINNYLKLGDLLDARVAQADKFADNYKLVRNNINQIFSASGAADCATLETVFGPKVVAAKEDAAALGTMISIFAKAGCKESDVYFEASAYAHKLNPTAATAAGCGYQSAKKKEYTKAIQYFKEAVALEEDAAQKYDYYYTMAALYMQMGNYQDARQSAYKALEMEANHGEPYMLIAQMYADASRNPLSDDKILAKTIYWAVVDKLEKAKSVDPSCAEKAQQMINTYRKYFPSKEDVFFKPELKPGESFYIGGWIGESVRCRD